MKFDVEEVLDRAKVPGYARTWRERPVKVTRRAEQIAQQAIELFNVHGASRLSINRLAAALGISPGNLHYHFRTNGDLYRTLFDILDADIRTILLRPKMPMKLDGIIAYQIDVQACLWHHRYFFRDLDYLIHADPVIFSEFVQLQNWAIDQLASLNGFYRDNFNAKLTVEPPQTEIQIAQNCWMMWISWVRWEAIALGEATLDANQLNEVLHRLTWQHFSHHLPYISPRVGFAIKRKLAKILGPGSAPRAPDKAERDASPEQA